MNDLTEQIKKLEIQEKKLRNRTIWLIALVPLLTILVSLITTYCTIQKEYKIDILNFTQEQISELIKEEDIMTARKKIKFLIEANLIGDKTYNDVIIKSLNNNLVNNDENNLTHLLRGYWYLSIADDSKNKDSIFKYYGLAFNQYLKSLELDPNNKDARAFLGFAYHQAGTKYYMHTFIERAFDEYNKALELDSTLSWLHIKKAQLYKHYGMYNEMCDELNTALKLGIRDSTIIEEAKDLKDICDKITHK